MYQEKSTTENLILSKVGQDKLTNFNRMLSGFLKVRLRGKALEDKMMQNILLRRLPPKLNPPYKCRFNCRVKRPHMRVFDRRCWTCARRTAAATSRHPWTQCRWTTERPSSRPDKRNRSHFVYRKCISGQNWIVKVVTKAAKIRGCSNIILKSDQENH